MYNSKFNKAFTKILNSYDISLLYQSTTSRHTYLTDTKIQQSYNINNLKIIQFKDNNNNLINEKQQKDVNFGTSCLTKIFNSQDGTQFNKLFFMKNLNKNLSFYDKILNMQDIPLYIYKFDFNNPFNTFSTYGIIQIYSKFHIDDPRIDKLNISQIQKNKLYSQDFSNNYADDNGLLIYTPDFCLMFINTEQHFKGTIKTVQHELTHYFQYNLEENLIDFNINITYQQIQQILTLGISLNNLSELLNPKQFYPTIKVDLISRFIENLL